MGVKSGRRRAPALRLSIFYYADKLKFNFADSYKNHPEEHGRFLRVICHNIILQLYAIILALKLKE